MGKEADKEAWKEAALEELDTIMEGFRLGKVKFQYHTAIDFPTKEEAMENFRRGRIDRKYEEKWQQT